MAEILVALGASMGGLFVVVLTILTILIPIMIYTGQKYAYKCFLELQRMNGKLERIERNQRTEGEDIKRRIEARSQDPDSIFHKETQKPEPTKDPAYPILHRKYGIKD